MAPTMEDQFWPWEGVVVSANMAQGVCRPKWARKKVRTRAGEMMHVERAEV